MAKKSKKAAKAGKRSSSKAKARLAARDKAVAKEAKAASKLPKPGELPASVAAMLRVPDGPVDLELLTTDRHPAGPRDKDHAAELMAELGEKMADLQERLYASAIGGGDKRRVLLVLQGMDTAGKDGVIKNVFDLVNPAGVEFTSFKSPTREELDHDFLWRIEKQVPHSGMIGVFNRSQYEDVLIVRVHDLVPKEVWSRRYAAINAFERKMVRDGVTVIKCFLHVSKQTQAERLAARLADPTKYWKFNPADLDERAYWDDYHQAYETALDRCSTVGAPWYVIPADRKWYRNWAVAALLAEKLTDLDPQYPPATFDVTEQQARLAAEMGL